MVGCILLSLTIIYGCLFFLKLKVPPQLKVHPQLSFSAHLISSSFCENSNLPSNHYDMLACLCNFCI